LYVVLAQESRPERARALLDRVEAIAATDRKEVVRGVLFYEVLQSVVLQFGNDVHCKSKEVKGSELVMTGCLRIMGLKGTCQPLRDAMSWNLIPMLPTFLELERSRP
jgi:hypothetical protein